MFENLSVVMTIHHILTSNTDKTFDDNGSSDEFDLPIPDKFLGKTESCFNVTSDVEPTGVKCYVKYHVKKYRFWVKTYDELELGEEVSCNKTCETLTQE